MKTRVDEIIKAMRISGITGDSVFRGIKDEIDRGNLKEARSRLNVIDALLESAKSETPQPTHDEILFATEGWESDLFNEIEEAVRAYVEGHDGSEQVADLIESAKWPLAVCQFRRMRVTEEWIKAESEWHCERVLESWHEDFGDEAGDTPDPTPEMVAAVGEAILAAIGKLTVWGCEEFGNPITVTKEEAKAMLL